ncbi:MAG: CHASE2 domain-containing protein [Gammaproteobacteria bacterium]|nr:CHASE2 domain-containing protein [Gammaproteobacteria bacterium]
MKPELHRSAAKEWVAISVALVLVLFLLIQTDWLWRWDQLLYDMQFKLWSSPPSEDIVIVAIDGASLGELGRWPWSRGLHAELVQRLTAAGVKAMALDILFAEENSNDPLGDLALIEAVAASGRVVLPVVIEQYSLGGQLVEALPMLPLMEVAAALGHVHIDLDLDGIARRVHLFEGIGAPYWPSLSVALLQMIEPGKWQQLPGERREENRVYSEHSIVRDYQVLIPFLGPPGHFPRVSFIDVLKGKVPAEALRDKIALVGVTASGLGDGLPTPVSGRNQPMQGIEINANLIDALRRGATIERLGIGARMLVSGPVLFLTFLVFLRLPPKSVMVATGSMILFTLVLSLLLLHGFYIWFPPTVVVIGLILGYLLWSWRRLEHTMRYFEQELERLQSEPKAVPFYDETLHISSGLQFLGKILSLDGWVLRDQSGQTLQGDGRLPGYPGCDISDSSWTNHNGALWVSIPREKGTWYLGLSNKDEARIPENARRLLVELMSQSTLEPRSRSRPVAEHIESQIQSVQLAIAELRTMRGLISDTLRQMMDGLLVVNPVGQVVLANSQARSFLGAETEDELRETDIMGLTGKIELQGEQDWAQALREVLVEQQVVLMQARIPPGKEVLVQMSPLSVERQKLHGMIVILSDVSLLKESERKRAQALHFLSHDLRSPLTSLLSLARMRKQGNGPHDPDELVERLEFYTRKALQRAEDFLQLARAENVDQGSFQETDFVAIAHNALDEVYTNARSKKIQLIRSIAADEAWVMADSSLLERVLLNLLSNAINYSPEGSTVELHLTAGEKEVVCCIEDQGQGISDEDQQKIFDPFERLRNSAGVRGGTGLGLAFVKVVALKHQGTIEVDSTPGKGSRFCLRIPSESLDG